MEAALTPNPVRRRRSAHNRVDLMLIVAVSAAFVAIAAANHPHARAHNRAGLVAADVSGQVVQVQPDPGLARARIGAARMTNG